MNTEPLLTASMQQNAQAARVGLSYYARLLAAIDRRGAWQMAHLRHKDAHQKCVTQAPASSAALQFPPRYVMTVLPAEDVFSIK